MFSKKKQQDYLKSPSKNKYSNLKDKYFNWKEALMDAAREVQNIQVGFLFGIVLTIISVVVGLVYDIPRIPSFLRLKLIPAVFLGFSWNISMDSNSVDY